MNRMMFSAAALGLAASFALSDMPPASGIRPGGLTPPGSHVANAGMRMRFPEITGPHVLIASCSRKADAALLEEACAQTTAMLRMPIKTVWREFDGAALDYAKMLLAETNVAAVVVVKDEVGAPSLLAMPEQKTVVVNPLAWCPDGTDKAVSDARMRKMLQRGYCAVMGATLAPVFSAEDLDALRGGIAPTAISSVFRYGKVLGMERMTPIMPGPSQKAAQAEKAASTNASAAK